MLDEKTMKAQFRKIARMYAAIEKSVIESGALPVSVIEDLMGHAQLTPVGQEALGGMLLNSPILEISEDRKHFVLRSEWQDTLKDEERWQKQSPN